MRRKIWAVYRSQTTGQMWISKDKSTPFYQLRNLDHFQGIFATVEEAEAKVLSQMRFDQARLDERKAAIKRQVREFKRQAKAKK